MCEPEHDSRYGIGLDGGHSESYRKSSLVLTAQRDQQSLAEALAELVGTLPLARQATVYQVRGPGRGADVPAGHWQLHPVPGQESGYPAVVADAVPGAVACLEQGESVELVLEDGSVRLIQPVRNHLKTGLLVVLDGFAASPPTRALLADLAQLVGNLNQLHAQSERDGLTGLYNRQVFDRRLSKIQGDLEHFCRRRSDPDLTCYLALLDLDHFKRINDSRGHLYGDAVLVSMAQMMERSFRYTDELFRYGGEEFAVILRQVTGNEARYVLERLRERVSASLCPRPGAITISIGYCRLELGSPLEMIDRADRALYFCKNHGRNRVVDYAEVEAEDGLDKA